MTRFEVYSSMDQRMPLVGRGGPRQTSRSAGLRRPTNMLRSHQPIVSMTRLDPGTTGAIASPPPSKLIRNHRDPQLRKILESRIVELWLTGWIIFVSTWDEHHHPLTRTGKKDTIRIP